MDYNILFRYDCSQKPKMALKLYEVENENEFDGILNMLYKGFGDPYDALRQWFIPSYQYKDEAATIEAFKKRTVDAWKDNPNNRWVKVLDIDTGEVIGAAEWTIRANLEPTADVPEPIDADWHQEGSEERDFASKLMSQLKGFMETRMTRPHIGTAHPLVVLDGFFN